MRGMHRDLHWQRHAASAVVPSCLLIGLFIALGAVHLFPGATSLPSPHPIHQGDLVLRGDNVTVIEGRLDINGSIVVLENARLILRNAVLNFTQGRNYQYNITFRNSAGIHPNLVVDNASVKSGYQLRLYVSGNSSASMTGLKSPVLMLYVLGGSAEVSDSSMVFMDSAGSAVAEVRNCSLANGAIAYEQSVLRIEDTSMQYLYARDTSTVEVSGSDINLDALSSLQSVNCSIRGIRPGHVDRWDLRQNCSVAVGLGGSAPEFMITDTNVAGWNFAFSGQSNAEISDSALYEIRADGTSTVSAHGSSLSKMIASYSESRSNLFDSTITKVLSRENSEVWLVNSSCNTCDVADRAEVYLCWHLDVHAKGEAGQNLAGAYVTVAHPSGEAFASQTSGPDGSARLYLPQRSLNATGWHDTGPCSIRAVSGEYSGSTTFQIARNDEITLQLERLVIPECPACLFLALAAGLAVSASRAAARAPARAR